MCQNAQLREGIWLGDGEDEEEGIFAYLKCYNKTIFYATF
jgi:hypothetical protein